MRQLKKCFVLRKSTNANSFGLHGYWILADRTVYSFCATEKDYELGAWADVPFYPDVMTQTGMRKGYPQHELVKNQGELQIPATMFLAEFNKDFVEAYQKGLP